MNLKINLPSIVLLSSAIVAFSLSFSSVSFASHCYSYVCQIDSYCCDVEWDSTCDNEYSSCTSSESSSIPTTSCTSQYYCSGDSGNDLYLQYSDCSSTYIQYCSNGCSGGSCNPAPSCTPTSWCSSVSPCQKYNVYSDCSYGYTTNDDCTSLCASGQCSGGSCVATCSPSWSCLGWSSCDATGSPTCSNSATGTQTRTCSDGCGNTKSESQSCTITRNTDGAKCGTQDCDNLDTTCRNYNDVDIVCSGGSCPSSATCNSYTNAQNGIPCTTTDNKAGTCSGGTCIALDTTAPTVTITSPTNAITNQATTFSSSVSDNVAVTSCSLYVGGSNVGSMSLSSSPCVSCTASRSHTFTASGSYSMYASCSDTAGNSASGASATVTVSSVSPVPTPPAGACDMTTTHPTDSITLPNKCSVTITHMAKDTTDGSDGKYKSTVLDTSQGQVISRDITFDDDTQLYLSTGEYVNKDGTTCNMDIYFLNNWNWPANNKFKIASNMLDEHCKTWPCGGHDLSFGYNITVQGSCKILSSSGSCYKNDGGILVQQTGGCDTPASSGKTDSILLSDSLGKAGGGSFDYIIGECSNESDCIALKGSGYTCDTTTNLCISTTIGTPTLSLPTNGATTSRTPILDVSPDVTGATSYHFYARTSGQTSADATERYCSPVSLDQIMPGTLSLSTTYYWSAKACTDSSCGTCGGYAFERSFTVGECDVNDLTYGDGNTNNDRSNACISRYPDGSKPRCRSPDLYANPTYTCIAPEACGSNPDCPSDQCCTKEITPDEEGVCIPNPSYTDRVYPPSTRRYFCTQ